MLVDFGILASAQFLVPPSTTGRDRERHAGFLADKLVLAFAALAVAPPFLASRGAPTPIESLLFTAMLMPGAAALVVARTSRLVGGHAVAAAGYAAIGLILFLGLGAGAGVAIAWLVAAGVEVAASRDRFLHRRGGLALGGLALAVVAAALVSRFAPSVPEPAVAMMCLVAAAVAGSSLRRLCAAAAQLATDVAERVARAEALDAVQNRVVLDLDADGSLRALSRPAPSVLVMDDEALLGRGLFDHVHVADRPAFMKLVNDAAHGVQTTIGRVRLRVDDARGAGAPCHLQLEMRAKCLSEGSVVAILEDVSDRGTQADELEKSRHAIADALRAKDQFMTTMSHELRTPLNAIIGFSEMLASRTTRPEDVTKQCEFARTINQSGRHLLGVVNAVLDVSRLQSGTYPIRADAFDAASLIDQSIEAVAGAARDGAIELKQERPPALEEIVGDKRALKAALVALLENAIKFTPARGQVRLHARLEGTSLVVDIVDTGYGIAGEDMARLGQPFFQAGGSLNNAGGSLARPFDGAGLGLALVRGIVGLHGGGLAVESEIGRGTTVTLRLPLDCRAIADRTSDLEIITRRPWRTPNFAKEAA